MKNVFARSNEGETLWHWKSLRLAHLWIILIWTPTPPPHHAIWIHNRYPVVQKVFLCHLCRSSVFPSASPTSEREKETLIGSFSRLFLILIIEEAAVVILFYDSSLILQRKERPTILGIDRIPSELRWCMTLSNCPLLTDNVCMFIILTTSSLSSLIQLLPIDLDELDWTSEEYEYGSVIVSPANHQENLSYLTFMKWQFSNCD